MVRVAAVVACAGMVAGCDFVFPVDPGPAAVRISFDQTFIGTTLITRPLDLTAGAAEFLTPDPSDPARVIRVPARMEGPTIWVGDVAPGTPVLITLPGSTPRLLYAFPNETILSEALRFGHPDPSDADMTDSIDVATTLTAGYQTTHRLELFTIGAWTRHIFGGSDLPGAGSTAFNPAPVTLVDNVFAADHPLERLGPDDLILVLHYNPMQQLIGTLIATPTGAAGLAVNGPMTAVGPAPMSMKIDPSAVIPEFAAALPPPGTARVLWQIMAVPGANYALRVGPRLAEDLNVVPSVTNFTAQFANPFSWPALVAYEIYEYRVYSGVNPPVDLYASKSVVRDAAEGLELELDAPLPTLVSIGTTALADDDNNTIMLDPTETVEVKFDLPDNAPPCDLYSMHLYRLQEANPAPVTFVLELSLVGLAPRWTVPNDLFTPGPNYVMQAVCTRGGYPAAENGDLEQRELPSRQSYIFGGVFSVQNP